MKHVSARLIVRLALASLSVAIAAPMIGNGNYVASASTTNVPLCEGSKLWGAYVGTGAATGNFVYTLALINVGHTTCRLEGYPRILGQRDNRTHTLPISKHGTWAGNLRPTVLSPRMSGQLLLSTADNCNALNTGTTKSINRVMAANTYSNLTIQLPDSKGDVYVYGFKVDIACGLEISQLGWGVN